MKSYIAVKEIKKNKMVELNEFNDLTTYSELSEELQTVLQWNELSFWLK